MRAWMAGREGRFALRDLYEALGIPPGLPRERVARDLRDFVRRGEVVADPDGRCNGNRYRYVGRQRRRQRDSRQRFSRPCTSRLALPCRTS